MAKKIVEKSGPQGEEGVTRSLNLVIPENQVKEIDDAESGSITPSIRRKISIEDNYILIREYENEEQNSIKRFVINPNTTKDLIGSPLKRGEIHNIEQKVFELALKELNSKLSAQQVLDNKNLGQIIDFFPNNVVLVDIFKREGNKIIEDHKRKCTEIHTLCLWKKTDNTIVLIDPSNSDFSSHLKNPLDSLYKSQKVEIEVNGGKGFKIYSSSAIRFIGMKKDDSRDCIDISVKIAFKLNEEQKISNDIQIIQQSINFLSNQNGVNDSFLAGAHGNCVRDLQSSSSDTRNKVLNLFNKNKEATEFIVINTIDDLSSLVDRSKQDPFFKDRLDRVKESLSSTIKKIPLDKLEYLEELQREVILLNEKLYGLKKFPMLKIEFTKVDPDVNHYVINDDDQTELHLAAQSNNYEKVLQLLEEYYSISNKPLIQKVISKIDKYGQTALHWATSNGSEGISELLINIMTSENIAKSAEGNNSYTALHLAIHSGNNTIVKQILDKTPGAAGIPDAYGQTALHWATGKGDDEATALLLNVMDPIDIVKQWGKDSYTALHMAVHSGGNNKIVKQLLDKLPGLAGITDIHGQTALHWAAGKGDDVASALLINSMEPEDIAKTKVGNGYTALHLAIHSGNNTMVKQILEKTPGLAGITDIHGQTALHWAGGRINNETIKLLINAMTPEDTCKKSTSGNIALDWIEGKVSGEVIELLNAKMIGNGLVAHGEESYWYQYSKNAMDMLLQLRLNSTGINEDIEIVSPNYILDESIQSVERLIGEIITRSANKLLVILNLYGKHWVGIAVDKNEHEINFHYMDSEQKEIPSLLKKQLIQQATTIYSEYQINLIEARVEVQKYNNCGPETIENFIAYLTNGNRVSQEDAVPLHSQLLEKKLLSQDNEMSLTSVNLLGNGDEFSFM